MIKRIATVVMLATATVGFTACAVAQDAPRAAQSTQQQQQTQKLVQQLRQKTVKLRHIRAETLKSNPSLRREQQAFVAKVKKAIKNQGYDLKAGRQRIQNLTSKLNSGNLSKAKRQSVMQALRAERTAFAKARAAALQQPGIQKAAKQLQHDVLVAMMADNDRVVALIQEIKALRKQLRAATQAAPSQ